MKFRFIKGEKPYFSRMMFFNTKKINLGLGIAYANELWYNTDPMMLKDKMLLSVFYKKVQGATLLNLVLLGLNIKLIMGGINEESII